MPSTTATEPVESCRSKTPGRAKDRANLAQRLRWQDLFQSNARRRDEWVRAQAQQIAPGARVLDVGAGRGPYRALFAHCDYRAHDFGSEPATIGYYTPLDYCSDIVAIPVADGSFDVVLCTEVLEHVPEPIRAVHEMARLLKPGGLLLLSAPLNSELHQQPYHFYGGYTPHWYEHFLPGAGLQVESIEANRGFFSFFAQEGQRFSAYLHPKRNWRKTAWWPGLLVLWLITLPLFRLVLPLLALPLDHLQLERTCTVGYHVKASKVSRIAG